ncbi:hypothetical protein ES332_A09G099100v1 [Gossypium tomentosum]|uniref:Uncharacterized protein n=1 Tax=Gossypium tomentosum TaxID=34277 RepID=A0A5D2P0R3_GOSTO|nr:hypothetical protein ES332_A09G099100v1 [Gossypium tomentosum]
MYGGGTAALTWRGGAGGAAARAKRLGFFCAKNVYNFGPFWPPRVFRKFEFLFFFVFGLVMGLIDLGLM